jgi:hypothetical protein
MKPRHKFNAKPVEQNGRRYASKAEARYAQGLEWRKRAGEVVFWLEQVGIHLPGKTRYVVDFVIFEASGEVRFVDVKGMETDTFRMKKRMVEELYPIEIEVTK